MMNRANFHHYGNEDAEDSLHHRSSTLSSVASRAQMSTGRAMSRLQDAFRRKSVIVATVAIVIVASIIAISVSVTRDNNNSDSSQGKLSTKGPILPAPEVVTPKQLSNKEQMSSYLTTQYADWDLDWNAFGDEDSAQYKALEWLTGRDEFNSYDSFSRVQRYALATFYYATFMKSNYYLDTPTDWKQADKWLTDSSECEWHGIDCDASNRVIAIELPEHAISGSLPIELGMLSELQEIDLTTNFIHVEDGLHSVWKHLPNLKILKMEDNFIVTETGLPEEFAYLTNIETIQLSYNLLQGILSGSVISKLQKLQHFEIESNYLSGPIPSELGALPDLIYVYIRRNSVDVQLHTMLATGLYPSLFSLWLDDNNVFGSIPDSIGQIQDLASFSVTNSSLTGSIPSTLGLLQGLRRVWLYDNKMTGSIPPQLSNLTRIEIFEIYGNGITGTMSASICNSVASSIYEFKALTADCDQITCVDCCTTCF